MNLIEKFKQITTFILDVDGVLTDGTVYVFENGEQVRRMSIKDGFALQLAVKKGYRILVISGSNSPAVVNRLKKLGITDIFMNVLDKRALVAQYISDHKLQKDEVLCMGDDVPDCVALKESGLPVAPADAVQEVKKIALYVTQAKGGEGCVREVMEKVLKLNGHWELETDIPSR
ncbi:MAG: HAD-IIIA family hydrolase [Chitinophagaceae bacterium]|nr:HAD-IIIA family hydrolase [Chitinophagaceae bacterium]